MTTRSSDISQRVLLHKVSLILSGVSQDMAGKLAARAVAKELRAERQRERQARQAAPSQALTLSNATQQLVARLKRIFDRYLAAEEQEGLRQPLAHVEDASPQGELSPMRGVAGITKVQDRGGVPVGVWRGDSGSAERIPPSFFHGMPDRATDNWRHSISENERIETERREVWRERLRVLKATGGLA
jgi:hypothetical protein